MVVTTTEVSSWYQQAELARFTFFALPKVKVKDCVFERTGLVSGFIKHQVSYAKLYCYTLNSVPSEYLKPLYNRVYKIYKTETPF